MNGMTNDEFFAKCIDGESIRYNGISVDYKSKDPLAKNHVDTFLEFLNTESMEKYVSEQKMASGFEKHNPDSECYLIKESQKPYATTAFFILFNPATMPLLNNSVDISIQKMSGNSELLEAYAGVLKDLSTKRVENVVE